MLGVDGHAAPERVGRRQDITGLGLQPGRDAAADKLLGDAVEEEIGQAVGIELQRAVTGEDRRSKGQLLDGPEIGHDAVVVLLELGLVDLSGVEVGDAIDRERRDLVRVVRDLEVADERPEDARELARRVHEIVEIGEAVSLLGVVMDGLVRLSRGGRVDADAVLQEVPRDEVVESPDLAAVFRARIDPRMTASVHPDVPARIQGPALGLHVDDAGGPEAEFGRQGPSDEID